MFRRVRASRPKKATSISSIFVACVGCCCVDADGGSGELELLELEPGVDATSIDDRNALCFELRLGDDDVMDVKYDASGLCGVDSGGGGGGGGGGVGAADFDASSIDDRNVSYIELRLGGSGVIDVLIVSTCLDHRFCDVKRFLPNIIKEYGQWRRGGVDGRF
jgi:hypothetical protein